MIEYLRSSEEFSHVFVLDADAALVQPDHNTMQHMALELQGAGKELFLTNEDWLGDQSSQTRINGGLLFAKNTEFNKNVFEDMLQAHMQSGGNPHPRIGGGTLTSCASNEQLCLAAFQTAPCFSRRAGR